MCTYSNREFGLVYSDMIFQKERKKKTVSMKGAMDVYTAHVGQIYSNLGLLVATQTSNWEECVQGGICAEVNWSQNHLHLQIIMRGEKRSFTWTGSELTLLQGTCLYVADSDLHSKSTVLVQSPQLVQDKLHELLKNMKSSTQQWLCLGLCKPTFESQLCLVTKTSFVKARRQQMLIFLMSVRLFRGKVTRLCHGLTCAFAELSWSFCIPKHYVKKIK